MKQGDAFDENETYEGSLVLLELLALMDSLFGANVLGSLFAIMLKLQSQTTLGFNFLVVLFTPFTIMHAMSPPYIASLQLSHLGSTSTFLFTKLAQVGMAFLHTQIHLVKSSWTLFGTLRNHTPFHNVHLFDVLELQCC